MVINNESRERRRAVAPFLCFVKSNGPCGSLDCWLPGNHLEMKLMTAVCDVSSTGIFNLHHNFFINMILNMLKGIIHTYYYYRYYDYKRTTHVCFHIFLMFPFEKRKRKAVS